MQHEQEPCLGIDVGGSGIKGALVDPVAGEMLGDRHRIETPADFGFDGVIDTIAAVADHFGHVGPIGVGFPAVVSAGVVKSPPTAHEVEGWVGKNLAEALAERRGAAAAVVNDADAAGIAEMAFGVGAGRDGVVVVLTLGTGVGSAVFVDGTLVPNTELGKLYLASSDEVAEQSMASRVKDENDLSWTEWGGRVADYLAHVDRLFSPDLVIIGGGVSKKSHKYFDLIDIRCEVAPAEMRNQAGIVGAAVAGTRL